MRKSDRAGGNLSPFLMKKYKVIVAFSPPGVLMGHTHRIGDIMTPQGNVARVLMTRGLIEPIEDEPEQAVVEMAAMATADEVSPQREIRKKRRYKKRELS